MTPTISVITVFHDANHAAANLPTDPAGELHGLELLIGDEVKLVELGPDLWMWVGDRKFGTPPQVNPVVARVCRFPGTRRPTEAIRGTVVFTGPRDGQGQLTSLSTHWSNVVTVQSIEAHGAR